MTQSSVPAALARPAALVRSAVLALSLALLTLVLLWPVGLALAQEAVDVTLDAVGDSGVTGTARLVVDGEGTQVSLDLTGLAAGAQAIATLHAGTCDLPSASFAPLPDLVAGPDGRATASGPILFRGTDDMALAAIADGEHVISVQAGDEVVACGVIPPLSVPDVLPVTGGSGSLTAAFLAVLLGLGTAGAGAWLRRRGLS